jgi:hypothetical protein
MMGVSLFRYNVIAGLINTIVFAFLLITHKKTTSTIILLIGFMMLISFQALLNAFDSREFFMNYPNLSRVSWLQLSLVGPLIYLITKKITGGLDIPLLGYYMHLQHPHPSAEGIPADYSVIPSKMYFINKMLYSKRCCS